MTSKPDPLSSAQAFWEDTKAFYLGHPERRAIGADGLCRYLTEVGTKCAIGRFIPDGHPAQLSMDPIEMLLRDYPELSKLFPGTPEFLGAVQRWHDGGALEEDFHLVEECIPNA